MKADRDRENVSDILDQNFWSEIFVGISAHAMRRLLKIQQAFHLEHLEYIVIARNILWNKLWNKPFKIL